MHTPLRMLATLLCVSLALSSAAETSAKDRAPVVVGAGEVCIGIVPRECDEGLVCNRQSGKCEKLKGPINIQIELGKSWTKGYLTIVFDSVTDERCPAGTQCIHPGNAEVVLQVVSDTPMLHTVRLSICADCVPNFKSSNEAMTILDTGSHVRIRLAGLSPNPPHESPDSNDYVVELTVEMT